MKLLLILLFTKDSISTKITPNRNETNFTTSSTNQKGNTRSPIIDNAQKTFLVLGVGSALVILMFILILGSYVLVRRKLKKRAERRKNEEKNGFGFKNLNKNTNPI